MDVKQLFLGVLEHGEATGYDVKRYFEVNFEHFLRVGFCSIYPALNNLLERSLVACAHQCQDRLLGKEIYKITKLRPVEFVNVLLAAKLPHKVRSHFLVLMHFSDFLPAQHAANLIEEHIMELEQTLLALRKRTKPLNRDSTPGEKSAQPYGEPLALNVSEFVESEGERLISELVAA
jgi:DNA-binding PadR family transcriptional regulator